MAKRQPSPVKRLQMIAEIIEDVDDRCMAADGPVTPTLQEMTEGEMKKIYQLARPRSKPSPHMVRFFKQQIKLKKSDSQAPCSLGDAQHSHIQMSDHFVKKVIGNGMSVRTFNLEFRKLVKEYGLSYTLEEILSYHKEAG